MAKILTKIFGGTKSERDIRSFSPAVDEIKAIFATLADRPDDYLTNRLQEIRQEIADAREAARAATPEEDQVD